LTLAKILDATRIAIITAPSFANRTNLFRILVEKRGRALRTRNEEEVVHRKAALLSFKLGYLG
jgi:hypothetical protein